MRIFALIASAALALCHGRADAQLPASPVEIETPTVPTSGRDRERQRELILASFAECVVDRSRAEKLARAFITLDPMTEAGGKAGQGVTEADCLPKVGQSKVVYQLELKPFVYRYELLGAIYRRNFKTEPSPSISDLPVSNYAAEFADGKVPASLLALRQFGDCVARVNPAASHRLAMSRLYSAEEGRAVSEVMPHLEACMPPDSTVGFTRGTLRGTISEALLRLRESSQGSQG